MNNGNSNVNRRRTKRRGINFDMRAYYALAVVFFAVILLILCLTVFFRISKIEVNGVTLYREDQIINVGGAELKMNLIRTDTQKIVDRLEENLVYIDEVEVTKKYPSTLVITCKEAEKAADIELKDSYYVLSLSGRILEEKNPKPTGDIPVVTGFNLKSTNAGDELESGDSFKAKILTELLEELDKQGYENVRTIDIQSRGDIVIGYDDRIEIKLGSSADISYKLSYFKAVINSLSADYEGTLIYNGSSSGISAIPKEQELESPIMQEDSSSEDESSSESESAWTQTEDNTWGTDTAESESAWGGEDTANSEEETEYGGTWEDNTDNGYTTDYGYNYDY